MMNEDAENGIVRQDEAGEAFCRPHESRHRALAFGLSRNAATSAGSPHEPDEAAFDDFDDLKQRYRSLVRLNEKLVQARDYADAIVRTVREPLLILDETLRVVRANAAFQRYFNTDAAELEGQLVYELGDGPWNAPELRTLLVRLLTEESEIRDFEIRHEFPKVGLRTLYLNGSRLNWANHALILLAFEDVTSAQITLVQLREADRRKDEFLAMMAHEMRGPLAPMRDAVAVLQAAGVGAAAASQAFLILDRQLRKASRIVEDLFDTARITSGHIALKKTRLELGETLRVAAAAVQPFFASRSHALTVVLPEEPLCIDGDPERLDQVVSNLLVNAAKYTPPGGLVQLELKRDGANTAVISVSDNGIGLSAEMLPTVFDLFSQNQGSLDRAQGGLGIGLTVVRQIAELHGGMVEARSAGLTQGSVFLVRLPALAGPQASVLRMDAPNHAPAARRILVVDDNTDSATACAMMLEIEGHELRVAHDGPAALSEAALFQPHLVLLDIGLPGMDGYEVARLMRGSADHQSPAIVAVSGYGRAADRQFAKDAGFDQLLVKPASLDALRGIIAAL